MLDGGGGDGGGEVDSEVDVSGEIDSFVVFEIYCAWC